MRIRTDGAGVDVVMRFIVDDMEELCLVRCAENLEGSLGTA